MGNLISFVLNKVRNWWLLYVFCICFYFEKDKGWKDIGSGLIFNVCGVLMFVLINVILL